MSLFMLLWLLLYCQVLEQSLPFFLCVHVNNSNVRSAWSVQRDELREIFNDISSSSEDEEDEVDRHEDEDLNIMDTEDDLVRQLQDKLNESDSAQHESDRNSQIGERTTGFLCMSRIFLLCLYDYSTACTKLCLC